MTDWISSLRMDNPYMIHPDGTKATDGKVPVTVDPRPNVTASGLEHIWQCGRDIFGADEHIMPR